MIKKINFQVNFSSKITTFVVNLIPDEVMALDIKGRSVAGVKFLVRQGLVLMMKF